MLAKDMLAKKYKSSEMRRYQRIPLDLPVKAVINGIDDFDGQLVNISLGDLAIKTDAHVVIGDAAILYIETLDVIEGRIIRLLPDGFTLSFLLSRRRRKTLTDQLMAKANPNLLDSLDNQRASPRHVVGDQRMVCRLSNGASLFVRVIDMSVNGIAVEAPRKPDIGTSIHVGRMAAIVFRHTARGFVAVYQHSAQEQKPELRVIEG